jgi:hypothetical protein
MGEELPALPEDRYSLWLQHGKVVNCFTHGVGDPTVWDHDKHWEKKGYSRAPLYTVEQYRQGQRDAIVPYAERIRQLERDLAERKTASIDSPEFQSKIGNWSGAAHSCDEYTRTVGARQAWTALIAHIDGRTAGVAPELYTCIGKGGEYEHIGVAAGAGVTRGNLVHVYRDRANGKLFYRTPMDFDARMERIAAAPTPMNSGKGEA